MASLSPLTTIATTTAAAATNLSTVSLYSLPSKPSGFRSNQPRHVAPKISCKASKNDDQHQTNKSTNNVENNIFDRRNMLIGLGGLCTAATTLISGSALSKPASPDVDPKKPKTKPEPSKKNPHGHGHKKGKGHDQKVGFGLFSKAKNANAAEAPSAPSVTFPKPLNDVILTNVKRPLKSRSKKEKEDKEEVLIIELESRRDVYSKFDVYINDEDERPTKENRIQTEYAGSFVNVPHHQHNRRGGGEDSNVMTTSIRFGLTELLEDLGADDDEGVDVSIMPRTGTESVVIKDVRVEYIN